MFFLSLNCFFKLVWSFFAVQVCKVRQDFFTLIMGAMKNLNEICRLIVSCLLTFSKPTCLYSILPTLWTTCVSTKPNPFLTPLGPSKCGPPASNLVYSPVQNQPVYHQDLNLALLFWDQQSLDLLIATLFTLRSEPTRVSSRPNPWITT